MLQRIVDFSVKQPLWVALLTLALVITGTYQLRHLPIDAVPDITNNQVQVIAVSPSLGAVDVEKLITQPIEASSRNIPGLVEMRSFSRLGLSVITLVFEEDVDIYWARQQVNERLISARDLIPQGLASPYLAPVTTGLGEIYQYVLRTKPGYEDRYDLTELRTLQDWQVRRALLGVPGVADVSSFGGLLKQIEISVRPDELQAQGVTLQEIYDAVQANNQNAGGAYIHRDATQLSIRTEGMVRTPQELESIVVKTSPAGLPLLIKDVAEVRRGHAVRYGSLTYNGEGEVAGGVVMMLKGENSGRVIESVKQKIEAIQASLPEGVVVEPFLDRTKMVNSSIQTVGVNLAEGALIVVLVLVFFFGQPAGWPPGRVHHTLVHALCRLHDEFFWGQRQPHELGRFGFWTDCGRGCDCGGGRSAPLARPLHRLGQGGAQCPAGASRIERGSPTFVGQNDGGGLLWPVNHPHGVPTHPKPAGY